MLTRQKANLELHGCFSAWVIRYVVEAFVIGGRKNVRYAISRRSWPRLSVKQLTLTPMRGSYDRADSSRSPRATCCFCIRLRIQCLCGWKASMTSNLDCYLIRPRLLAQRTPVHIRFEFLSRTFFGANPPQTWRHQNTKHIPNDKMTAAAFRTGVT